MIKTQKPITFKNICGAIVDFKELAKAILWYSDRLWGANPHPHNLIFKTSLLGSEIVLKPALLYKDIILTKFTELLYTEDYYFYIGYDCGTEIPNLQPEEGTYHYAFVDDNDNVIGYLSYQIYCVTDTVHKFGLISFDKGNPIIGRDLFKKLRELVNQHHKIEWRVVGGNPVKKHYDKFCKKYNGYIHHFHDSGRDLNGNLVDSYLYEIIKEQNND